MVYQRHLFPKNLFALWVHQEKVSQYLRVRRQIFVWETPIYPNYVQRWGVCLIRKPWVVFLLCQRIFALPGH
jgi:hypothetical protein